MVRVRRVMGTFEGRAEHAASRLRHLLPAVVDQEHPGTAISKMEGRQ